MELVLSGIVIREKPINEADKLITVLTDKIGKITFRAKGVKSIKSKNASATMLFCYSDFELSEKCGRYTLKTAYLKESFFGIRSDILRYSLACYFLDTVNTVTTELGDETDILRLLLNSLYALSEKASLPLWKIKGAFELKLMVLCGFMPELNTCGLCADEIKMSDSAFFGFSDAFTVCDKCKSKGQYNGLFKVSAPVLEAMRYISVCPSKRLLSFNLNDLYSPEFSFICENYLLNQTERGYETLKIYKSMNNTFNKTENHEQ